MVNPTYRMSAGARKARMTAHGVRARRRAGRRSAGDRDAAGAGVIRPVV
jgi:hypothetical protein